MANKPWLTPDFILGIRNVINTPSKSNTWRRKVVQVGEAKESEAPEPPITNTGVQTPTPTIGSTTIVTPEPQAAPVAYGEASPTSTPSPRDNDTLNSTIGNWARSYAESQEVNAGVIQDNKFTGPIEEWTNLQNASNNPYISKLMGMYGGDLSTVAGMTPEEFSADFARIYGGEQPSYQVWKIYDFLNSGVSSDMLKDSQAILEGSGLEVANNKTTSTVNSGTGELTWEERFEAAHGRTPEEWDYIDKQWSEDFYNLNGRSPNEDEWVWHYYDSRGYNNSASTSTTVDDEAASDAVSEVLGELSYWGSGKVNPMLEPWAAYLRELLEQNSTATIPYILDYDAEATDLGTSSDSSFSSTTELLRDIQNASGITSEEGDTLSTKWQRLLDYIPTASFDVAQKLSSLRYNSSENKWYSVNVDPWQNLKYL